MSKFEILASTNGQYFWRFVSSNGRTLCHSETYHNKQDAITSARIVQGEGGGASIYDRT